MPKLEGSTIQSKFKIHQMLQFYKEVSRVFPLECVDKGRIRQKIRNSLQGVSSELHQILKKT